MLRLSEYLKSGGRVVIGDIVGHNLSKTSFQVCSEDQANRLNESTCGERLIKSFANRDNNGTQPVSDDFPVVITWRDSYFSEKTTASEVRWKFDFKWKPDYNRLLEQQNEYDKQQEKPIEEIMINVKESRMSEFKEHQRVYVEGHETKEWAYGCKTLDGKNCILLSDGGRMIMPIERVSSEPFKSAYELNKERLKKDQLNAMYETYAEGFDAGGELMELLECMQGNGELAEIIMTLEG